MLVKTTACQSWRVFRHSVIYDYQTSSRNSNGVSSCGDAKYTWVIKISRFSTNKSLYLANDTTYHRRRIGNRTRAFEWYQFE